MRTTHTYAILEISRTAFEEIKAKLVEAEYWHSLHSDSVIDMHGIAVSPEPEK